jgi:ribonuclease HII
MLKLFHNKEKRIEAGCDEAGRGCLAGPVFAAAVILPRKVCVTLRTKLNDSKKLAEKLRYELRPIIEQEAIAYGVAMVNNTEIDEINILNASFLAMHRALDQLSLLPETLLIDGNRFTRYRDIPHNCIIQGDGKYLSIAAASVLAKTYRDDYMATLHLEYPHYNWIQNKAYGTLAHRTAIEEYGISPYHRKSFQLLPQQLCFEF